ncbi:hypothetical protein [Natranaeroarchaeum sulfidigenes]|uniref:Uncharacterized protein n=1 Tax=Natranaeroarchaeum sulfidigenes TaxID=2784880 RepID=A0A897MVH3_9EURY|nr:hypothetical protein [Natranaeroarchaeum sulfidigenes]QSG02939.1 hypothetical protein AArcS_1729 [Natranaeroarchaeum sulfidigenes]
MARMYLSLNYGYPVHEGPAADGDRVREVKHQLEESLRVRLPEYTVSATFEALPEQDRNRLEQLFNMGTEALQAAADSILDVRSEGGQAFTHLHGYLAASSRNAPFLSEQLLRDTSVTEPNADELLRASQKFAQLTSTYLEVFAMLDATHAEVEQLVDTTSSAHEAAQRARHYFIAFALRHPAIDEVMIQDGLARRNT